MKHIILTILTVFLTTLAVSFTAHAKAFTPIPKDNSDLEEIRLSSTYIAKQSFPSCLSAVCVKGDCGQADRASASLLAAKAGLAAITPYLLRLREKQTDNALSLLENARFSQERIDLLKRLQLLQDTLQAVAEAAVEAADWQSFMASYSEKVLNQEKTFEKFLAFIKTHVDRVKKLLKLKSLGKEKQEKPIVDLLKAFAKKAFKKVQEIQKLYKEKGLKNPKTRIAVGKLIKMIGDLAINVDRERRRFDIALYMRNAAGEHKAALAVLSNARRINDRIMAVTKTKREVQKALWGVRACTQKSCQRLPKQVKRTYNLPSPNAKTLPALELINHHLLKSSNELQGASRDYRIIGDYQSRITLDKYTIGTRRPVRGKYALSNICLPSDARFVVYRGRQANEKDRPLGDYGKPQGKSGTLQFRLVQGLEGEWKDKKNRRYKIEAGGSTLKLTRLDIPVKGQTRTYTGLLDSVPARPGDYLLALHSQEKGQTYLPTRFQIKGKKAKIEIKLLSRPRSIDDINPRIPQDIRNELLKSILKERLGYRLVIKPVQMDDGETRLDAEFWTYRFKWGKRDRKIVDGSLKQKRSVSTTLTRVPDGT